MTHALRTSVRSLILVGALALVPLAASATPRGTVSQTGRTPAATAQPHRQTLAEAFRSRARHAHRQGELSSRDVAALLDEARAWHDARFERCLDRRLAEINAQIRMMENRFDVMSRAIDARDRPEAERVLALIETLGRRVSELEREAYSCPGARVRSREGRTRVRVTPPPGDHR